MCDRRELTSATASEMTTCHVPPSRVRAVSATSLASRPSTRAVVSQGSGSAASYTGRGLGLRI